MRVEGRGNGGGGGAGAVDGLALWLQRGGGVGVTSQNLF